MVNIKKTFIVHLLMMIIFFWVTVDAHAHRVTIFAWVDGDTVHTQSKFGGGKKVNNGQINVYDPDGNLVLTGNTDENGEFSFKVPGKTSLKIELIAGMGHKNEWIVKAEEIEPLQEKTEPLQQDKPVVNNQPEMDQNVSDKKSPADMTGGMSREQLEQAVESAVEKKMKPVMEMLSDLSDPGPRIPDVLGGIGYIIGLVGIAAYFKNRGKLRQ